MPRRKYRSRKRNCLSLKLKIQERTEELIETQEQYTALERKYLELVGPARSELNKYVVKIRYRKLGNNNVIEFQRPEDTRLTQVTEPELHRRLSRLKAQKGAELLHQGHYSG